MRKYQLIGTNGEIYTLSYIGVNHTANNEINKDNLSSYNKEFDNNDEVCLDDSRHCIIGNISEAYKILKEEIISKRPINIVDYSECVQRTIMRYFGDYSHVKRRLSYFPTDKEIEQNEKEIGLVSNLAHKNAALSIERAMTAQNLLMEIGIKSVFKVSGVIINDKPDIHAYNLLNHDGKYYLFDVTIPTVNNDKLSPLICELPKDVYDIISNPNSDIGIEVKVSYFNPLSGEECEVIYDAGRKDIYQIEKSYHK